MPKRFSRARPALAVLLTCFATWSAACASSVPALAPRELPMDARQRHRVLAAFGERLYGAVSSGRFDGVIANDRARDALLRPEAARRSGMAAGELGPTVAIPASDQQLWGSASYAGLCVQSGRSEPPAGVIGLRRTGFVFERGLLIGREAGGGELAGWVEGVFVLTQRGFLALAIERVEPPRRDHSDLELAECELADHRAVPLDVVSGAAATH